MTEPLDFSKVGAKPEAPAPPSGGKAPKAPKPPKASKRPGGSKASPRSKGRRWLPWVVLAVVVVAAGAVLYARSNHETRVGTLPPVADRYCATTGRLVSLLEGIGAPPTEPVPATVGADAYKRVVDQMGGDLDEMRATAPSGSGDDAAAVAAALRAAAAGDTSRVQSPAFRRAENVVLGSGNPCNSPSDGSNGA